MLSRLLHPRSIAVVGASNDTRKLRGKLLHTLVLGGYTGPIYPVNPGYPEIQGLTAYADLEQLPQVPDLVLIVVPGAATPAEVAKAARLGAGAAIIHSSGVDPEALRDAVGTSGLRLMGANTEGFYLPGSGLAPTFSHAVEEAIKHPLPVGRVRRRISIVSQSGGQGFALFDRGRRERLDFHSVIATANEVDLDCLDFVDHLVTEGEVGAILMFIEGLQRPQRFAAVAAAAADKGIALVVQKIGRSEAGQRAAVSHTAHLAGSDSAYDAMFQRYGVIRVTDPEQMLAAAAAFARLPPITRAQTAVITTSGGAGAWGAELLADAGVPVPQLNDTLRERIEALIPSFGSAANPVDVTASAIEDGGTLLVKVLQELTADAQIDAVVLNMGFGSPGRIKALRPVLEPLVAQCGKPVLFHSHYTPSAENFDELAAFGAHGFASFRACAYALHVLAEHGAFQQRWRAQRVLPIPAAAAPWQAFTASEVHDGVLSEHAARALLQRHQVPMPPCELAASAAQAVAAAGRLGYPVVLKIQSPDIPHKTEAGGVELNVHDGEVEEAYARIVASCSKAVPHALVEGVLVQKMAPAGHEVVIGIVDDADFGPLVMFGLGGIYVEVLKDVAFASPPLTLEEAHRMIRSLRGSAILLGARGKPPADIDALGGLLVRISELAQAGRGHIDQLDLNPVFVYPAGQGVLAVDALIAAKTALSSRQ